MATLTQSWIKAWNDHEVEKLLSLYDEHSDCEIISENYRFTDSRSFEEMVHRFLYAFPDLHFETLEKLEENDKVAMLWIARGTHRGKYINIPPTGKKLEVRGTAFFTLKNGKIVKTTFLWDGADMLRQMGLLPDVRVAMWSV
jgi:steroid delta-isomerase-like uncharacterized protein